ncbi:MAG: hypothetical protein NZ990_04245 [Myxococcota bacterium]|nr:hypothetical protein [Myxococcota bacterium]
MAAKILLALASAALIVVLLEGGARLIEGHPPWEEPLPPKALGTLRVAVVGGSTVYGTPLPELGFVSQLEFLFKESGSGRAVEVVNRGELASSSDWARRAASHVIATGKVDALVVLTAHNEFLNRSGESSWLRGWVWKGMLHSALVRLVTQQAGGTRSAMPERLNPVDRENPWFQRRLDAYRENLSEIVREARAHGIPVLLLTAPANLAEWPPVHHDIAWSHADPAYDAHVAELEALLEAGQLDAAERAAGAWRSEFGEDAMFAFLEGKIARQRGDPASARRLFRRAADLDPYPWRVLSEQNAFIRELAQGEGAVLVDVESAFARAVPDGLVGFGLVGDNVHPTPLGASLMALEVARGLRQAGLPLGEPDADHAARAERFLAPRFELKLAYLWLLLHGRYCMKTPFYYYTAARNYLESARQLAPLQWMAQANLGAISLLEGDPEKGLRLLREAARLRGEPFDPKKDRVEIPMLGVALEQAGLGADALAPP